MWHPGGSQRTQFLSLLWRAQDCHGATLRPSLSTPLGNIHDKRVRAIIGLNCEASKIATIRFLFMLC